MPKRTAQARWENGLKDGEGCMSLPAGGYEGPFSFASRFEEGTGTNPEELIGAAHAGCYSMALSAALDGDGHAPESVDTTASVTLEMVDDTPTITTIHLRTQARVPGMDQETFLTYAEDAKANCPVSRALAGPEITLDAELLS